jgi:hypothetical protein
MKHKVLNKSKQKAIKYCLRGQSWKQAVNFLSLALVIIFGFFSIVATGGGSSTTTSGDVSALTLPGRIELSKTEGGGAGGASIEALGGFLGMAFNDPGTDYTDQEKEVWVDDTDALDMVNSILGVCKETAYQDFVNKGPYKALAKPVSESEQSQGGSSTSSSTTESLMEVTLDVTRASNSDPMIIKIWVEESDGPGDMPMLIRGYFEVSEGVSAQYPYGQMEAHFKGNVLNPDGSEGDQVFTMAMSVGAEAGDVVIQFVEAGADGGGNCEWDNKVRVVANATVTQGNAYVYEYENSVWDGEEEDTAYYAFNEDYLKEKFVGEPEEVLDKNDFEYIVYRYKLFREDDGSAVTRNSGFPIQLAGGENAYIGYYGLWAPYGVETSNGDTVTRPDAGEEYTLMKKGGKLKKHTKSQITVANLDGVEMSYWDDLEATDYVITWDADLLPVPKFKKIGERDQQTGQITYYGEPVLIDSLAEWDGAWCEALNAYLPLGRLYAEGAPGNDDTLSYHAEEVVNPGTLAGDLTLYFWGFALDAPIDQTDIDGAPVAEAAYWANPPVEKTYTFDATDLVLKDGDEDPVIIGAGLDLSGTIYTWGYSMMPLVTTQGCPDPWNEDTYYSWETGQNEWNQYATVKDSFGDYEMFDAPLRLAYEHATAYDINGDPTHDGKTFNLEYDGFELNIPWEFDEDAGDWQPMINLKDGTVLSADGTDYVVKGTEVGLDLQEVPDPSVADDLIIDETVEPPTLTYDASKTDLVGDRPAGAELKVIKGEII